MRKLHWAGNAPRTLCNRKAAEVHITRNYGEVTCKDCLDSPYTPVEEKKEARLLRDSGWRPGDLERLAAIQARHDEEEQS